MHLWQFAKPVMLHSFQSQLLCWLLLFLLTR